MYVSMCLQSEYIGTNIFDMILHEDHRDVKYALQNSEANSASCPQGKYIRTYINTYMYTMIMLVCI